EASASSFLASPRTVGCAPHPVEISARAPAGNSGTAVQGGRDHLGYGNYQKPCLALARAPEALLELGFLDFCSRPQLCTGHAHPGRTCRTSRCRGMDAPPSSLFPLDKNTSGYQKLHYSVLQPVSQGPGCSGFVVAVFVLNISRFPFWAVPTVFTMSSSVWPFPPFSSYRLQPSVFVVVVVLSRVQLLATPWTVAYQVPQSIEFSRQEHWSGEAQGSCIQAQKKGVLAQRHSSRILDLILFEFLSLSLSAHSGVYTFLSSTLRSLEEKDHIHRVLDKITDTLIHLMAKAGLTLQQQHRRLAQLLLLLSHFRHMSNKGMEHLYNMKCKNVVPLYDLLLEMLDAHRLHAPTNLGSAPPEDVNQSQLATTGCTSSHSLQTYYITGEAENFPSTV
ncbi:hypothetical protein FD754_001024, partial [Muntiacus muntjak]